ncbi:MAG: SoxR reducing system RseC family protein [Candidatus Desulfofervidaceae bacterium]|nr:SoxR reducing system RseC family protein [Candidatus Desulfofervidaceae bacterium]
MSIREEIGTVVETWNQKAKVMVKRSSECERCKASGLCGMLNKQYMVLEAENPLGAKKGQKVVVSLTSEEELKAAFIVYGIPVIGFFIGALLGCWLNIGNNQNLSVFFFSILFLVLAFGGVKIYSKRYEHTSFFKPVVTNILNKP